MKSSILVLGAATLAAAQGINNLPPCGQTCIKNMISIAQTDFGCGAGNVTCYCTNTNFAYGVRDCSNQACSNSQQANSVIAFGASYCSSALSAASTTTGSVISVLSSAISSTTTTSSGASSGGPLAAATSAVSAIATATGVYIVGGSHTISVGGPAYSTNGIVYTAESSDVLVSGSSTKATVVPSGTSGLITSTVTSTSGVPNTVFAKATSGVVAVGTKTGTYVIPTGHTISVGGPVYRKGRTSYSAEPSGVVVAVGSAKTLYVPQTSTGGSNGAGGLAAATSGVVAESKSGVYVVPTSHTVSVGGPAYTHDGTTYTAASDGVVIKKGKQSTTYVPSSTAGTNGSGQSTTSSAAMSSSASSTPAPATSSGASSSSSTSSPNFAAMHTAAPGLIGAAALALMVL